MVRLYFSLILFFLAALPGVIHADDKSDREYSIKAVFLYNFSKFVRWPESAAPNYNQDGLRLCVVGENPFGGILEQLAEKVTAKGKRMVILRPRVSKEMASCHLLFVSASERPQIARILDFIKDSPVLVVGDTPDYGHMGVGINFYIKDNKIRFKIYAEAIEKAGLQVSSELLSLAEMEGGLK